jgi:hypothetical protein
MGQLTAAVRGDVGILDSRGLDQAQVIRALGIMLRQL